MIHQIKLIIVALIFLFPVATLNASGNNTKPFVVPELKEWHGGSDSIPFASLRSISIPLGCLQLRSVASRFASDCNTMFGLDLKIHEGAPGKGTVAFSLVNDKKLGAEGYRIEITRHNICIDASSEVGVFWGTRTLLQLAEQNTRHMLPVGGILDYPDYAVRGFMLDCARKFIPLQYLKEILYPKGETARIEILGNSKCTALKVNGKMVDILSIRKLYFDAEGKKGMNYVSTLVFPLAVSGSFASGITDFKVYNYLTSPLAFPEKE